jgi:hypothetical protein
MGNKEKIEVVLNGYSGLYISLLINVLGILLVSYLVLTPAFYSGNLFAIFITFYKNKYFFGIIGLLSLILLVCYSVYTTLRNPFKITFSEEGIRIYSLRYPKSKLMKWKDLTEFQLIKRQPKGITEILMQIVVVSNKFSTKSLNDLGPRFKVKTLEGSKATNMDRILELYQKNCPQLANVENIQHE